MMGGGLFGFSLEIATPSARNDGEANSHDEWHWFGGYNEISPRASLGRNDGEANSHDGRIIGVLSCPRGLPRLRSRYGWGKKKTNDWFR